MATEAAAGAGWNERLLRLERRNQRLTGLVVLLVLVAMVQTVWHLMPGPKVVFANRFVLSRGQEPPRGEFSMWEDGTPALRFNNEKGEARALWAFRKDGTLSLRMSDARFTSRLEVEVDPAGLPRVTLYGADAHPRASLAVNSGDQAVTSGLAP